MSAQADRAVACVEDVLLSELADGTGVLLCLRTRCYYVLNAPALTVYQRVALAGAPGVAPAALIDAVLQAFEVQPAVAAADVRQLLGELLARGLLREAP